MTKCPKCGSELEIVNDDAIVDAGMQYCINEKCKGWFCFYCDKWHKYGTTCSYAAVARDAIDSQEKYDKWCKEHKSDIWKMLKDSGELDFWIEQARKVDEEDEQ